VHGRWGNPPGAGPDEGAHYVKAIGVGGGDLYGRRPAPTPAEVEALVNTRRSPDERARIEAFLRAEPSASALWLQRTSREFTVPAGSGRSVVALGDPAALAGELLQRRPARLSSAARWALVAGVFLAAGFVHVMAWYANGRTVSGQQRRGLAVRRRRRLAAPLGW